MLWLYINFNKPWREGYIQANSNIQIETPRIYCYFDRTRKQTGEFIIQYQKYIQQEEKSVQTKASDSAFVLVDREHFAAKIQMLCEEKTKTEARLTEFAGHIQTLQGRAASLEKLKSTSGWHFWRRSTNVEMLLEDFKMQSGEFVLPVTLTPTTTSREKYISEQYQKLHIHIR